PAAALSRGTPESHCRGGVSVSRLVRGPAALGPVDGLLLRGAHGRHHRSDAARGRARRGGPEAGNAAEPRASVDGGRGGRVGEAGSPAGPLVPISGQAVPAAEQVPGAETPENDERGGGRPAAAWRAGRGGAPGGA